MVPGKNAGKKSAGHTVYVKRKSVNVSCFRLFVRTEEERNNLVWMAEKGGEGRQWIGRRGFIIQRDKIKVLTV